MSEPSLVQREPVALVGLLNSLVVAVLAVLVAFGVDITDLQSSSVVALVAIILNIGGFLYARRKVTPVIEPGGGRRIKT